MESTTHQKLKILVPTNPFSHNEESIKFIYNNINYGCSELDIDVDIEIINWQASNTYDELIGNTPNKETIQIQSYIEKLDERFDIEIKKNYSIQKKLFKNVFNENNYKNINSVSISENFDYWFRSYGAVYQFKQIHDKILENQEYDYLAFVSTNYIIHYKYYFKNWIKLFSKHENLPIHHPLQNYSFGEEYSKNNSKLFVHAGNVNSFICKPKLYKNLFDSILPKYIDFVGYEKHYGDIFDLGAMIKDITTDRCISFVKNSQIIDKDERLIHVNPNQLLVKDYFPIFGTEEPAVSFFNFYFTLLFRNPNKFKLDTKNVNGFDIPICLLERINDSQRGNGYFRCTEFYEPYRTHEFWVNFFRNKLGYDYNINGKLKNLNEIYYYKIKKLNFLYQKYEDIPSIYPLASKYIEETQNHLDDTMDSYIDSQMGLYHILKNLYL